jgi:orotidine-5'-phosphate decarboxylase
MKPGIFVALDVDNLEKAIGLIELLYPINKKFKIGLELVTAVGLPVLMERLEKYKDIELFLDLKLHDIPNTVIKTLHTIIRYNSIRYLTVHGSNNLETLKQASIINKGNLKILAVTVLTSIGELECNQIFNRTIESQVNTIVDKVYRSGIDGVVCSVKESMLIKSRYPTFEVMCPGIHISETNKDQVRSVNINDSRLEIVDNVVIGRAITLAIDPASELLKCVK